MHLVGNPMIDTLLAKLDKSTPPPPAPLYGSARRRYVVATLHRPANVDSPESAAEPRPGAARVAREIDVIIPLHPRGRATLTAAGLPGSPRIHVVEPLGYIEFMSLVRGAAAIVTDSGGVQEETTLLRVPCLTLRPNTERPITITSGSNRLVTQGRTGRRGAEGLRRRPLHRASSPRCGTAHAGPRIARGRHRVAGPEMTDAEITGAAVNGSDAGDTVLSAESVLARGLGLGESGSTEDPGLAAERSGCRGSCATPGSSWR